jgi:hypothetical protein
MNNTKSKILKEKTKDEEGGLAMLSRLTKLGFLPKFWILDVQALFLGIYYKRLFLS